MRTQQIHFLEEQIRQLEEENERLLIENQYQRQEYERFANQLTTMVIEAAVIQEVRFKKRVVLIQILDFHNLSRGHFTQSIVTISTGCGIVCLGTSISLFFSFLY